MTTDEKAARLAQALRENLKRRKAQARAGAADQPEKTVSPKESSTPQAE